MRVSEVCNILKAQLPQVTDTFSETVLVTSLSIATGVITATTTTNHGLVVGDDITLSAFNVATDYPAVDSDVINTRHTVATVVSPTQYTINITPRFISGSTSSNGKTHTKVASFVALDENFALDSYVNLGTNKTNVAHVIDGGMVASRDRTAEGDMTQTTKNTTDFRLPHINTFTVLIFVRLNNDTIGTEVSDALRQLMAYLVRSLAGVELQTDWRENKSRGLTLTGMEPFRITQQFVAQAYDFQEVEYVTADDINRDIKAFEIQDIFLTVENQFL